MVRNLSPVARFAPIGAQLELKYGMMLSTLPVSMEKKQTSMQGVYQGIGKEGIVI